MEHLIWIVSGVLLLMALTALKAVWKLKADVQSLQSQIDALKKTKP